MNTRLSLQEMGRRLTLREPDLIKKILAYSEQYWQEQLRFKEVVDDKAHKAMNLSGLCLTILCTLGTFLTHLLVPIPYPTFFGFIFILCGLFFLGSAFFYYRTIQKAQYYTLSHEEILHQEVLQDSDKKDGTGVLAYERSMAKHFLDIGLEVNAILKIKNASIKKAERCFLAGLVMLAGILVFFLFAALHR